jgi:hypothetical protein
VPIHAVANLDLGTGDHGVPPLPQAATALAVGRSQRQRRHLWVRREDRLVEILGSDGNVTQAIQPRKDERLSLRRLVVGAALVGLHCGEESVNPGGAEDAADHPAVALV